MNGRLLRVVEETSRGTDGLAIPRDRVTLLTDGGIEQFILEDADSVVFVDPEPQKKVAAALSRLASHHSDGRRRLTLESRGTGSRSIRVGYVVEVPLWKASYRLSLPADPKADRARLQGWAILENFAGDRRGRRPDGGDQSISGRCRARSATVSSDRADLWRALRSARHRERGFRRPFGRKPGQSRSDRRHAVLGPGLDARQARSGLLPEHLRIAEGPRRVLVPESRRQRYGRYRPHRQRGGGEGGLRPALHPHSQDHRQRFDGKRPHARLSLGGAIRGPGVHRSRPRQSLAAGRLRRGSDGPPCRVPDRRIGRRKNGRGRRSASDLSTRAHLRRNQIRVRGQVGP